MDKQTGLQRPHGGPSTGPKLTAWQRRIAAATHPVVHATPILATGNSLAADNDEDELSPGAQQARLCETRFLPGSST
ncbi:MAG TPA: hypothetical protein VIL30_26590 [Ramlibacter sp.]|jgi:hypothetical protein